MNALLSWFSFLLKFCGVLSASAIFVAFLICLIARRKRLAVIVIGLLIFILGYFAYLTGASKGHGRSDTAQNAECQCCKGACDGGDSSVEYVHLGAINRSLSSFWPSRGDYEGKYGKSLLFWFFHTLAILYVSSVAVALFGMGLVNFGMTWCRLRFRRKKEINVFWDFSNEARWVAETIPDKNSVVFSLRESSRSWLGFQENDAVQFLSKDGFRWIFATPGRNRWLSSADHHFFLGANGHENVSGAEELIRNYHGKNIVKVFVRISSMADDDVLYAWADKKNKMGNVEVVVVREEAVVANKFLWDHPMLECCGIKAYPEVPKGVVAGKFRVLLVGFGGQGERLMSSMICDSQYLDKDGDRVPIDMTVVDRDEMSFGWYEANCQTACKRFGITFEKMDANSKEFWEWLKGEEAFGRIVVCTKDDRINISIAHDISRLYKTTHADIWQSYRRNGQSIVYARVRDALISKYVGDTYEGRDVPFLTFGSMKEIYDFKMLVETRWWMVAVWVNALYCGITIDAESKDNDDKREEARKKWQEVTSLDRESSFVSAFNQRNLLRLLGHRIVDNADSASDEERKRRWETFRKDAKDEYWNVFSKLEHLRWMAFYFVRGIECWRPTKGELQALKLERGKIKANMLLKTGERHVHAALVEFDELPSVDALFNEVDESCNSCLQNFDKALTYGFEALEMAGFGIREEVLIEKRDTPD